jgi:hypothetical protein
MADPDQPRGQQLQITGREQGEMLNKILDISLGTASCPA